MVVRHIGNALVKAMEMALDAGKPEAAQVVAAECVVLAETKDHLNWELIGEVAKKAKGEKGAALKEAHKEVEEEEDEHLSTPPAGPGSCGSRRWACRPSCRRRRRRRK